MQDSSSTLSFDNIDAQSAAERRPAETPVRPGIGDKHIWGIYIALCIISLIELYSASSREVASSSLGVFGPIVRHVAMLLGGFGIMVLISRRTTASLYPTPFCLRSSAPA